jgi:hypothetical protein
MAAARQGLPVRLDRAPQRGAAFAVTSASRRARMRSIGSRSRARGSSLIFDHPPAVIDASRFSHSGASHDGASRATTAAALSADQRWLSAGLQQQPDESLLRARPEHEAARGAARGRRVPPGLLVEPTSGYLHRDAAAAVVSVVSLSGTAGPFWPSLWLWRSRN